MQQFLPAPALTILLDIAPETAVQRKAVDRDRYERDLALQARVRDSYQRQAPSTDWVGLDGERAEGRRRRRRVQRRERHDSRCRKRAHLTRAAPHSSVRAHASSVAPVVLTSSTSTIVAPRQRPMPRAGANAPRTLRWRRAAGSSACGGVARTRASAGSTGNPR